MTMARVMDAQTEQRLLDNIDNPCSEDRWGDARAIADRMGWPRRGMTGTLDHLRRRGLVEAKEQGERPSFRSDAPPRLWRRSFPRTDAPNTNEETR